MRVVAAMSGGVDSSVTAALLMEQGHEVIGVHMKLHDAVSAGIDDFSSKSCCGLDDVLDCRRVADRLGIPFYVMDLREEFQKAVMDNFADNYIRGLTPNPCIQCNGILKFRILLNRAQALGASHLATGHYAQITPENTLMQAVDQQKDQSYFLFPITSQSLAKILFPLGGMTKSQVREHALRLGLVTASKPESQDVCFIPDNNHTAFIDRFRPEEDGSGNIILEDGTIVGQHQGFWRYTIGQRKGLGVALGARQYVIDIDAQSNTVMIGNNDSLFHRSLTATKVNWFRRPKNGEKLTARIRHRGYLHPCTLEGDDSITVSFQGPVRAITPGQAVVIYSGIEVLAGGWITKAMEKVS